MTTTKKQEEKPEIKRETVVLKNDTIIEGVLHKAGTQIEATAEMKKLLKPFGYFIRKDS